MGRSVFETILGGLVLVVAAAFLFMAYQKNDGGVSGGYQLKANFNRIDGLNSGADVMLSGVKVGNVASQHLNPATYMAELTLTIDGSIKLPRDTVALIASEGLMGGKYISLEVGGDENLLNPGDRIEFTQTAPSLEQLIGQVIFSAGDKKEDAPAAAPTAAPATAPATAPSGLALPEHP